MQIKVLCLFFHTIDEETAHELISYIGQNIIAIEYVEIDDNRAAEIKLSVDRKIIREWRAIKKEEVGAKNVWIPWRITQKQISSKTSLTKSDFKKSEGTMALLAPLRLGGLVIRTA